MRSLPHELISSCRPSTERSPSALPQCPAPHNIWSLLPAPASPPGPTPYSQLQTHTRISPPIHTSEPVYTLCLLPKMPLYPTHPLQLRFLVPSLGRTLQFQAELASLPSPHPHAPPPVTFYQPIHGHPWACLPPWEGRGCLTHLGAPAPAQCRVHSRQQYMFAEEQITVSTWPQPSLTKQARTSLGMSRGWVLVHPLPLQELGEWGNLSSL